MLPNLKRLSRQLFYRCEGVMKRVLIIGAGPAGLTAAYELLKRSREYSVTVLEEADCVGGISKTVNYKGNRMDMGGHRFFSKSPEINAWWEALLPTQGAPAIDDRLLGRCADVSEGGPDPEETDRVMLIRKRISRIWFRRRFFDYPITLKAETIRNMGVGTTAAAIFSYLRAVLHRREERSLEDFYINRFGRRLYSMFFEDYTAKLWGRHPAEISPDWGAQRVRGVSIRAICRDIYDKYTRRPGRQVETSLIEAFRYPKLGPGELWEITADEIEKLGGTIFKNSRVTGLRKEGSRLCGLAFERDGAETTLEGEYIISSMPVRDLVAGMNDVPEEIRQIAAGLPYRDYITVGVLTSRLTLKNETDIPTIGDIVPDNWVYVQDASVHMGRFQIYNNWSPYMVGDPAHTVWLGLEYFCTEGDALWSMTDEAFGRMAVAEMLKLGLVESSDDVLDFHVERVKKAYPAYFGTYDRMDKLRDWLSGIENLYCVGRNGQHRYNNMDHSMCTAFEAVRAILEGSADKSALWNVNTEETYHESYSARS